MKNTTTTLAITPQDLVEDFELKFLSGSELTQDFLALRRSVFSDETGLLKPEQAIDINDKNGTHVLLYRRSTNELIATVVYVPCVLSNFPDFAGVPREKFEGHILGTRASVKKEYRKLALFPLIMYALFSKFQRWGYHTCVFYAEDGDTPIRRIYNFEFDKSLRSRQVTSRDGRVYEVHPVVLSINYMMQRCFESMPQEYRNFLQTQIVTSNSPIDSKSDLINLNSTLLERTPSR